MRSCAFAEQGLFGRLKSPSGVVAWTGSEMLQGEVQMLREVMASWLRLWRW